MLTVENNLERCPLCGSITNKMGSDFNDDYPYVQNNYFRDVLTRSMLLIAIALSAVAVLINTYMVIDVPWSIIAIVGAFYLFFSIKFFLRKLKNYGFFILVQVALISLVIFAIDYAIGYSGWSVDYVIPFVIIAGGLIVSVICIIKPLKYKEYLVYILVLTFLGLLPLVLILTNISKVQWGNRACVLYSILTIVALVLFTRRRLNSELRRRLHF